MRNARQCPQTDKKNIAYSPALFNLQRAQYFYYYSNANTGTENFFWVEEGVSVLGGGNRVSITVPPEVIAYLLIHPVINERWGRLVYPSPTFLKFIR